MNLLADDKSPKVPGDIIPDVVDPRTDEGVRVIDSADVRARLPIIEGAGEAKVLCWPGNGARHRSLHLITLEARSSTVSLSHASECVYYVVRGTGEIDGLEGGERFTLTTGSMVHIDAGDRYAIRAGGETLSVVGGPCPPDPAFYASLMLDGTAD